MDTHKKDSTEGYGLLPVSAPLANPYVPFQAENALQYDARKGLVRGTLYPGLDLPFMGMVNKVPLPASPMSELQALAFAVQELALYLDTHRDDMEALELYRKYQQLYKNSESDYNKHHGPINHMVLRSGTEYDWLDDPWPWDYCGKKEGK